MVAASSETLAELQTLEPYEFEHFVADLWEARGWETEVLQQSNDQGVDVIARKTDPVKQTQVIQAKRYAPGNNVGGPEIREYASLLHQVPEADTVVVATTSGFTRQAESIADNLNVRLVGGDDLVRMAAESFEGSEDAREAVEQAQTHRNPASFGGIVFRMMGLVGRGLYGGWRQLGDDPLERGVQLIVGVVMAYILLKILLMLASIGL